jgi:hypothetical protein
MFARCHESPGAIYARLYSWAVGTITIGLNQRYENSIDVAQLGETPVIRRVTGGRAVFHDPSEFTYCIALNLQSSEMDALRGSVSRAYAVLGQCLGLFLARLGTEAELVAKRHSGEARPVVSHKAPCFASTARYELQAAGRKVVASAQRQINDTLVQHGSIKLVGIVPHPALPGVGDKCDVDSLQQVDRKRLEDAATVFREVLGKSLCVEFDTTELTSGEAEEVRRRVEWTRKNSLARRDPIKQTTFAKSL